MASTAPNNTVLCLTTLYNSGESLSLFLVGVPEILYHKTYPPIHSTLLSLTGVAPICGLRELPQTNQMQM